MAAQILARFDFYVDFIPLFREITVTNDNSHDDAIGGHSLTEITVLTSARLLMTIAMTIP
jgi:hypothetical protein